VAVGLLAVVAFPLAAAASASRQPMPQLAALPPIPPGPGGVVRNVPVVVPVAGFRVAPLRSPGFYRRPPGVRAALTELADIALGRARAGRLLALPPGLTFTLGSAGVPDDPGADAVIGTAQGPANRRKAAALTDLGALLQLAEANGGRTVPGAAPALLPAGLDIDGIAMTALGQAARTGSCAAELDFLLEVLSDQYVPAATLQAQLAATDSSCPGDPTPGWLFGEAQPAATMSLTIFKKLEHSYPASPAGWSGEADFVSPEAQYLSSKHHPFTADAAFRRAALLLARAQALERAPDPGLQALEAQDFASAGDPSLSVPLDRAVLAARPSPASGLQLADDLERTRHFSAAGRQLGHLPRPHVAGPVVSLYPLPQVPNPESAQTGPSLGAGTRAGLQIQTFPPTLAAEEVLAMVLIPPSREDQDPFTQANLFASASASNLGEMRTRDLLLGGSSVTATRSGSPLMAALGQLAAGHVARSTKDLAARCNAGPPSFSEFLTSPSLVTTSSFQIPGWCDGMALQDDTVGVDTGFPPSNYGSTAHPPTASQVADRLAFDLENLWRWAGRDDRAAAVTRAWAARSPRSFLAADQSGEVAYLSGYDQQAVRWFRRAAARAPSMAASEAEQLKLAQSLEAAGHEVPALRLFGQAAATAHETPTAAFALEYIAAFETGGVRLHQHRYASAVASYEAARRLHNPDVLTPSSVVVPAAIDTDEGLADVQAGRPRAGFTLLRRVLATDPGNAVFLQNLAYAERRAGERDAALRDYRKAVAADPTNYPAANDLGVLLAEQGHPVAAVRALRDAVGAGPGYALSRFNLGVVLATQGVGHILEAQGDEAQAIRMDPGLADQAPLPQFDDSTVFTTLDLARPPPPGWHFAEAEKVSPGAAAGVALLVLLIALGRELARDKTVDKIEELVIERSDGTPSRRKRRWSRWRPAPVIAALATAAVLTWPLAASNGSTWTEVLVLAAAVVLLVATYMRVHHIVSRPADTPLRHHTWIPPMGVAGAAAVAHLAFAPLPVAEPQEELHRRRRWMAPLVIGVAGVVLLLIAKFTDVPLAKAFGSAALVITSSALLPVEPSDGAYLGGRLVALAASVTLLIVSSLLFLGIL
jgi:tetratricopeptide (TPR) repeat protein